MPALNLAPGSDTIIQGVADWRYGIRRAGASAGRRGDRPRDRGDDGNRQGNPVPIRGGPAGIRRRRGPAGRRAGRRLSHPHLQPRQFRPRPSAPLPRHRPRPGRAAQQPFGADPFRLADHRQLRFPLAGRFRARARRHQAAQRRNIPRSTCISACSRRWRSAPRSSATPPKYSRRTCFWSTRSRSACAARSRRRWPSSSGGGRRWCSACAM